LAVIAEVRVRRRLAPRAGAVAAAAKRAFRSPSEK
jgi:hypothetical protein